VLPNNHLQLPQLQSISQLIQLIRQRFRNVINTSKPNFQPHIFSTLLTDAVMNNALQTNLRQYLCACVNRRGDFIVGLFGMLCDQASLHP